MEDAVMRDVFQHPMGSETFLVHITIGLNGQGCSAGCGFRYPILPNIMEDILDSAKSLLRLVRTLPSEPWADTFIDYSAPEVQRLSSAVDATDASIEAVERISGQLAK